MTRVFPRSKQFFLLYVLIGSRWNFPYYAIGCCDYFAFVFRTFNQKYLQNTAFAFLDASVFAFYWGKSSVFRPLQIDVSVTWEVKTFN